VQLQIDCKVDQLLRMGADPALADGTIHLAVAFLDEYRRTSGALDLSLAVVASLKLADCFNQISNEYFARERVDYFIAVSGKHWTSEDVITAERQVAERLRFQVHRPTASWFLRSCFLLAGEPMWEASDVRSVARYFLDLSLLDDELQVQPASLRAQVALLLAVYAQMRMRHRNEPCKALLMWTPVRVATCWANTHDSVAQCFARMVHVVSSRRDLWSAQKLHGVDRRHPGASTRQLPRAFPQELLEELLPPSGPDPALASGGA